MSSLGAPVRVSPTIKTVRWGGLLLGFFYGWTHFNTLQRKENALREEEAKLAVARNAEMLKEKARLNKVEMDALGKQMGIASK